MRGKRRRKRCFSEAVGGVSVRKVANPRQNLEVSPQNSFVAKIAFRSALPRIILAAVVF